MKNRIVWIVGGILLLLAVLLFIRLNTPEDTWICKDGNWIKHGEPSFPMPTGSCKEGDQVISSDDRATLPNPASKNCTDKGGKLEMLVETAGSLGICKFTDGSECEEWQYFRGECLQGQYKKADTSHPYLGIIEKKNSEFVFKTETGVEYQLKVPKEDSETLQRVQSEADAKQSLTIIGAEDPPLSKTLWLKGFQNK